LPKKVRAGRFVKVHKAQCSPGRLVLRIGEVAISSLGADILVPIGFRSHNAARRGRITGGEAVFHRLVVLIVLRARRHQFFPPPDGWERLGFVASGCVDPVEPTVAGYDWLAGLEVTVEPLPVAGFAT
jgi:hypothetical protein